MAEYRISVVRYKDEQYKEEIDKILIGVSEKYDDAVETFVNLMKDASFSEAFVKHVKKDLNKKIHKFGGFRSFSVQNKNFHGYLGPGGYILEKVKG